jgi:excisionase family DNA binding protein
MFSMAQQRLFDDGRPDEPATPSSPFEGPRPLSTRECADFIGVGLDYIYGLIKDGELEAHYIVRPGKRRGVWVVPQEAFIACLKKLKWSHIPKIW